MGVELIAPRIAIIVLKLFMSARELATRTNRYDNRRKAGEGGVG